MVRTLSFLLCLVVAFAVLFPAGAASARVTAASYGCPSSAPDGTLRAHSSRMGVYNLCVEAALAAPSPAAAAAVKFALRNLGVPYVRSNKTAVADRDRPGFFDCSSYVSRAYAAAGVATKVYGRSPNTTELRSPVSWARIIPSSQARPGDIAVFATHSGQHAVMLLPRGLIVHTNNFGDVSHVASARQYPQLGTVYATYLRVTG